MAKRKIAIPNMEELMASVNEPVQGAPLREPRAVTALRPAAPPVAARQSPAPEPQSAAPAPSPAPAQSPAPAPSEASSTASGEEISFRIAAQAKPKPRMKTKVTCTIDAEIWERFSELCHRMNRNKSDLANELFGRVSGSEDILREYYGV
jgi:hypothetical protein